MLEVVGVVDGASGPEVSGDEFVPLMARWGLGSSVVWQAVWSDGRVCCELMLSDIGGRVNDLTILNAPSVVENHEGSASAAWEDFGVLEAAGFSDPAPASAEEWEAVRSASVWSSRSSLPDDVAAALAAAAADRGVSVDVRSGEFQPWFKGADSLTTQAQRQVAAAGGTPIRWSVAEADAVTAINGLFADQGISGIKVVHVPAR